MLSPYLRLGTKPYIHCKTENLFCCKEQTKMAPVSFTGAIVNEPSSASYLAS